MANIRISQLPTAPDAISGSELVPIVQNGQTVQTTVSAITNSPSLTQTFLTTTQESTLPNSRYIGGGLGIGTSDAGAQGLYSFFLNGTSASLENASTGIIVKSGVNTVVNRLIAAGTAGLSVSNGNGISGNPTLSLTDLALSIATLTGNGMVSLVGGSYFQNVTLTGTADQISIANPNGGSNPTFSIANNPTFPGTSAALLPRGTSSDRVSVPTTGMIRYNTQTEVFEGYTNTGWNSFSVTGGVTSFSAGSTGFTPVTATTGAVTLGGTLNTSSGGTGASGTLTGYVYGNGTSAMTASTTIPTTALSGVITNAQLQNSSITIGSTSVSLGGTITTLTGTSISGSTNTLSNIGNSSLTNSSVTYNGVTVALGASGTITATATNPLTISTGLQLNSGTTYDGSVAKTISIDSTVVTLTGSQTLTNKTMSGASNTFSNIGNSSLTNSSLTINGTSVSLGGSITVTATASNALTIGAGLSGTSYNGSSPVTIAIDSTVVTLSGSQTLTNKSISGSTNTFTNIPNSGLTNSSLTIGTTNIALGGTSLTLAGLTSVTVTQDPVSALQLATKQYVDTVAQGLDAKASCVYGTTNNITLSGLGTQAGGDWASSLTAGDRILVKNQSSSQFNGIYVAAAGTWSRSLDMDTWAEVPSSFVFIESGSTLADTGWVTTANAGGTIDVTPMPWVQFSGAGTYTAGTGLTLTGTQFSLTSPVTTSLGGTGSTSALTQYGVVYGSTTSAMATTAAGTSTQVLHGNASGAPTFGAVSLTADVSGTLPVGNGGTGITSLTANYIPYGNGSSAFQSSANHTFDGTTLTLGNAGVTARFQGDFSNATVASRTAFVTGTTNGSTGIYALPNGSSTAASWQATNNASPTNASKILIATNGSTDVQLVSGVNGSGTYLPLTFWNNGAEKARLSVAGGFSIGTATDAGSTNLLVAGTATALGGIAGGTF